MSVTAAKGFQAGAVHCGLKSDAAKADLAVLAADGPCVAAGLFTTNHVVAAPVIVSRQRLASGRARAVVVNAGNANACTGEQGLEDAHEMTAATADALGIASTDVLVASTGIIGRPLPMDRVVTGIAAACRRLARGPEVDEAFARAIMTTDTVPKSAVRTVDVGGRTVTIGGAAKGAGMIGIRMATMLGFVTTDAAIEPHCLRLAVQNAADRSFNAVTVDGHMSTNDTLVVLASGRSGCPTIEHDTPEAAAFERALNDVGIELARALAADGEGATKLVEVVVRGTRYRSDAELVAKAVANSPLVKTAVHGADPNWGRIVSAAGYSGVAFVEHDLTVTLADVTIYRQGEPLAFDADALSRAMAGATEVRIELDFTLGDAAYVCWTCDLSREYITINADYHT